SPPTDPPPVLPAVIPAPRLTEMAGINPDWTYGDADLDRVALTRTASVQDNPKEPEEGLRPTDILGQYLLRIPSQQVLDASTIDYETALSADDAKLREWFTGRVVLLGDARQAGHDGPFPAPDGRPLPGFVAQAVAIESLLGAQTIRQPS